MAWSRTCADLGRVWGGLFDVRAPWGARHRSFEKVCEREQDLAEEGGSERKRRGGRGAPS